MDYPIIVVCGLPGTNKAATADALQLGLLPQPFERYGAGQNFRKHELSPAEGKHYDVMNTLRNGKGVILNGDYRTLERRKEIYVIASTLNTGVVLVENVCSERMAKSRMKYEMAARGTPSANGPSKNYKIAKRGWEDPALDLKLNPHVSLIKHDIETESVQRVVVRDDAMDLVARIEKILAKTQK